MARSPSSLFVRLAAGTVMLLAVVTLAAVALHGWNIHLLSLQTQGRAVATVANLGAVQLGAAVDARGRAVSAEEALIQEFDHWSAAALQQPRVLLAALVDGQNQVLRSVPAGAKTAGAVAAIAGGTDSAELRRVNLYGAKPREVWVVTRTVGDMAGIAPLAGLVIVADQAPLAAAWASWSLIFAVPLSGIAALSFVVALRWLRRLVQHPLNTLMRRGAEDPAAWLARLPTGRSDEVGCIARGTGDLLAELRDVHSELERLHRTLDSRVAARTRQINTELGDARREAWFDPLTGLGNRRLLDCRLEEYFEDSQAGDGLVVVMFDVDNFKALNDTLGHAAGDDLLRFFGQLLSASVRSSDVATRYAGDEFVVLLPGVSLAQAEQLARRIVSLFAQKTSALATRPRPTLSAGVVSSGQSRVASGAHLIKLADAALYRAKEEGKNGVYVASTPGPRPRARNSPPAALP